MIEFVCSKLLSKINLQLDPQGQLMCLQVQVLVPLRNSLVLYLSWKLLCSNRIFSFCLYCIQTFFYFL